VHDRFRTEAHHDVVARFNERFLLSLADCAACLVLDDELNVLTLSDLARTIEPVPAAVQVRPDLSPTQTEGPIAIFKAGALAIRWSDGVDALLLASWLGHG
jgi:N-acetyltransferase 10